MNRVLRSKSQSTWRSAAGLFALLIFLAGCSSAPKITRMESDAVVDVSGYWNDTDSQMVSSEMITDAL